jgi:predicted DNA binding CopG/RHH family protein
LHSSFLTPHSSLLIQSLGNNTLERLSNDQKLFVTHMKNELQIEIRSALNSCMAIGNSESKQGLETQTEIRLHKPTRGRKLGQCKIKFEV